MKAGKNFVNPAPSCRRHASSRGYAKTNFTTRSKNDRGKPPSAAVLRALLPPHPALSLGERENRLPRLRQSKAAGLVPARDTVFPLPAGEGQGEGKRDAANQNGRANFASST